MMRKHLSFPGKIVKKSNALTRAHWKPESIWEPRIVALVASKVRESDEDFFTYRIPVTELTGISDEKLGGIQYREIARSIEHLSKATIRIEGKKPSNFRQYNIFSMCGYEDGYLIARFDPDLKPHFLNLKAQFTAYNLFEYLNLPSSYSQRIFEILKSWANAPEVVISVAELHEMLNAPASIRKDFRLFRTRVLEKSHKDILAHTSLSFEWEPIKIGRSIKAIRFLFAPGRKALAEKEIVQAKEDKKRRLLNQRLFRAVECAKNKDSKCAKRDNKPIICKVCVEMQVCDLIKVF